MGQFQVSQCTCSCEVPKGEERHISTKMFKEILAQTVGVWGKLYT